MSCAHCTPTEFFDKMIHADVCPLIQLCPGCGNRMDFISGHAKQDCPFVTKEDKKANLVAFKRIGKMLSNKPPPKEETEKYLSNLVKDKYVIPQGGKPPYTPVNRRYPKIPPF